MEVSAAKALPLEVWIEVLSGERVRVEVEYERVPDRCGVCCTFGHLDAQCPFTSMEKGGGSNVESSKEVAKEGEQEEVDRPTETEFPPQADREEGEMLSPMVQEAPETEEPEVVREEGQNEADTRSSSVDTITGLDGLGNGVLKRDAGGGGGGGLDDGSPPRRGAC